MTTEFDISFLSEEKISFWDRTNKVSSDASKIYLILEPFLINNQKDKLINICSKNLKEYIQLLRLGPNTSTNQQFYSLMEDNSLSRIGVYWFKPKSLIHILLQEKNLDSNIMLHVNKFLDELIHTYAQNKYQMHYELRVNILFSELLKNLPSFYCKDLIARIQNYEKGQETNMFITDCIEHIVNQISIICKSSTIESNQFFTKKSDSNFEKLKNDCIQFNKLSEVIDKLKKCLEPPYIKVNAMLKEQINVYLRSLSIPILSIEEKQNTEKTARTIDYLGSFT
jgi:hypothetical protein